MLFGDLVCDIGERCRSLVRRDYQVGVITIEPNGVLRGNHLTTDSVVGQFQQRRDELAVTRDAILNPFRPVGRVSRRLDDEATLRTDRDDHGVLHHLGFDQTEDLGSHVLWPVTPAQATSSYRTEAQVHPGNPWGAHPNLIGRDWSRDSWNLMWRELDRECAPRIPRIVDLERVGSQSPLHNRVQLSQNPVGVEAGNRIDGRSQLGVDRARLRLPCLLVQSRIQPCPKQVHEQFGNSTVRQNHSFAVLIREGRTKLTCVLQPRTQPSNLAPRQAGC